MFSNSTRNLSYVTIELGAVCRLSKVLSLLNRTISFTGNPHTLSRFLGPKTYTTTTLLVMLKIQEPILLNPLSWLDKMFTS